MKTRDDIIDEEIERKEKVTKERKKSDRSRPPPPPTYSFCRHRATKVSGQTTKQKVAAREGGTHRRNRRIQRLFEAVGVLVQVLALVAGRLRARLDRGAQCFDAVSAG